MQRGKKILDFFKRCSFHQLIIVCLDKEDFSILFMKKCTVGLGSFGAIATLPSLM